LLAETKKKYAADPETVGDVMRKELNLVDGGDDHDEDDHRAGKQASSGFDLT
jgi:hypothetical protein